MGNKVIENALKEMFPKIRDRKEASRCITLLLVNGGAHPLVMNVGRRPTSDESVPVL